MLDQKRLLHQSQRIRKGRQLLRIPGGLLDRQSLPSGMAVGQQSNDGKQCQQGRRDAQDRQVRPLSLGLHAQLSTHFMKSDFDLPASYKPLDDLLGRNGKISAKQSLGLEDLFGIPDNDPTDGQRRLSRVEPDRCLGANFNPSLFLAIPLLGSETFPTSVLVLSKRF